MGSNLLNGWDRRLRLVSEATFGTTPAPANVAAYAAQMVSVVTVDTGPAESGVIRPKQDRGQGRAMQDGWVEGRVEPIPFSIQTSLKSRAAVDTVPQEDPLFAAAGLKRTVNASTSVVYGPSATPVETGDFKGLSLERFLGSGDAEIVRELLRGGIVREIVIEGGDKEVRITVSGVAIGKQVAGGVDSITLANGSGTTLATSADEAYQLAPGYYICESEIIQVTAVDLTGSAHTIARGALGSTGAAHSAKPLKPYIPTGISYTGSPISEALTTGVTLDGNPLRVVSWRIAITTGMDAIPGETGSKYSQGAYEKRTDIVYTLNCMPKGNDVRLANKSTQRKTVAVSITQGTAAGGVFTAASSYCEVVTPSFSEGENAASESTITLRARDNGTGNNSFSITLT